MPLNKVKAFLDAHGTKYVVISHSKAYTAQGIAAIAHISGRELAKTVIVKLDAIANRLLYALPIALIEQGFGVMVAFAKQPVVLIEAGDHRQRDIACDRVVVFRDLHALPLVVGGVRPFSVLADDPFAAAHHATSMAHSRQIGKRDLKLTGGARRQAGNGSNRVVVAPIPGRAVLERRRHQPHLRPRTAARLHQRQQLLQHVAGMGG